MRRSITSSSKKHRTQSTLEVHMAPKSYISFLKEQWAHLPEFAVDLTGKTVIVVGANVGLGFEAAKKLANMNPRKLILACRNQSRGDDAVKVIKEATGCPTAECWTLDLANFKSISAFVDRFETEGGDRLDILLANAGALSLKFHSTGDGWENMLQVNHLGTSLLALLLLPKLSSTPNSRTTFVSSVVHHYVKRLNEADSEHILSTMNDPKTADMRARYNASKLLNVFFTRALAARIKSTVLVTVNAVNPGFCKTQLLRTLPFPISTILNLYEVLIARTSEYGSRTLTHAALWGTKEDINGKYLNCCKVEEVSDYAISDEGKAVEKRLWDETIEILENVDPRVKGIVTECLA